MDPTTKRLVFLGTALGNGLSGSEVLKLTSIQAKRIDASICNKLRCMMKGKAAWTDPDTGLVYRMTSIKVWRFWRLSPYALESCIRRIKWWQVILVDPANNAHIITTFFGRHKYNDEGGDPLTRVGGFETTRALGPCNFVTTSRK